MFRMALQMGCTVHELGARLSSAELTEWLGFHMLEPFGPERADDRARGMMAIAAMAGGAKGVRPADFLQVWRPKQEIDDEAKLAGLLAWLDGMANREG